MPTAPITAALPPSWLDQDRNADRRRHHREGCEGIAHDHREHDHAERVEQHGEEDAALGNDRAGDRADGRADARRRRTLRRAMRASAAAPRPADRVRQAGCPSSTAAQRRRPQPDDSRRASAMITPTPSRTSVTALASMQADVLERRVVEQQCADEGGQRDDQRGQEQPVAEALRETLAFLVAGRLPRCRGRAGAARQCATSARTSTPLPISPRKSPNQKLIASSAQKAALPQRLRIGRVARAAEREAREDGAGEDVEPVQRRSLRRARAAGPAAAGARRGSGTRRSRSGSPRPTAANGVS